MKKYNLVGVDGNAFCVMGYVAKAMRECGMTNEEISEYRKDAMSSNYDHLLAVSFDMIEKLNGDSEDDYNPIDEEELFEAIKINVRKQISEALKTNKNILD